MLTAGATGIAADYLSLYGATPTHSWTAVSAPHAAARGSHLSCSSIERPEGKGFSSRMRSLLPRA